MNIQNALQQANLDLSKTSPSARLDAQVLLTHILNCNTAHLAAWPEKELSSEQEKNYLNLIQQRQQGLPVAHLTGSREFWSLNFLVNNSTLIPRPETETLIEFILENFGDKKELKLLDIGTGTGAIALSIANEKPAWEIIGSDISKQAIQLANSNKEQFEITNCKFTQSDWFNNITTNDFDIIVSNPPYIANDDPHLKEGDVRFEPHSALTSGDNGMDDIEHLCTQAKNHLKSNSWLIIEHGYNQQHLVAECFAKNNFIDIEQKQDLAGHVRMTAGKKKL